MSPSANGRRRRCGSGGALSTRRPRHQRRRVGLEPDRPGGTWWNDTFYEVYGFDRNTPPSFEAWASHIHPDDRERVMAGFRAVVEHGEPRVVG